MKKLGSMIAIGAAVLMCLGCGNGQNDQVLTIGVFGDSSNFEKQLRPFTEAHPEISVEIQEYELQPYGEDSFSQLKMEISSGKGPDVIQFGSEYSACIAAGDLTENLYEYMEADEKFEQDDYFTNILETFAIDGKLAAVPDSFIISTAVGKAEYYEGTEAWDFTAISAVYDKYREEKLLYPGESKLDVFGFLCSGTISQYLDWQNQVCRFDSEEFKELLAFADQFPQQMVFDENMKLRQMYADGEALLYRCSISNVWTVGLVRELFGGQRLDWLGYPVTGNVAESGAIMLGINVNSRQKDRAWELIKYFLSEEYQTAYAGNLPLHKQALAQKLEEASRVTYSQENVPVTKELWFEGEEPVQITAITEEDREVLLGLIASVKVSANVDYSLYNIVLEEVQGYFAGDRELEEVVKIIQGRVKIAMAELL